MAHQNDYLYVLERIRSGSFYLYHIRCTMIEVELHSTLKYSARQRSAVHDADGYCYLWGYALHS